MRRNQPHPYDVLIVNNDKIDQLFLNIALNEVLRGSSIITLNSGKETLDFLRTKKRLPDLVLLNLNIGELSGKALISIINNTKQLRHIPVIVLSNIGTEDELRSYGATAFYQQPFDLNKLIILTEKIKRDWLIKPQLILKRSGQRQYLFR